MKSKKSTTLKTFSNQTGHRTRPADIIDTNTLPAEERRRMIREGEAEWRSTGDGGDVLVRVAK